MHACWYHTAVWQRLPSIIFTPQTRYSCTRKLACIQVTDRTSQLTSARCIKTNILTSQVHQRQVSVIVYHDDLHYLKKDEADSTRLSASSDKESKTVVW